MIFGALNPVFFWDNVHNLKYVWIILLKNDFFGFPKVKWLQYTGKMGKCIGFDVKFSQDLTHQKSLKLVTFWQSYSKNKKVDVFGTQCTTLFIRKTKLIVLWQLVAK